MKIEINKNKKFNTIKLIEINPSEYYDLLAIIKSFDCFYPWYIVEELNTIYNFKAFISDTTFFKPLEDSYLWGLSTIKDGKVIKGE